VLALRRASGTATVPFVDGGSLHAGRGGGHSVAKSIHAVGGGTVEGILTLTAILWVLLIPFFAFAEVQRSLGRAALLRLLFERRDLLRAAT
jgi:hypothetical protein